MGTNTRRNSSYIIDDLIKNGPAYNVWQAVRIADSFVKKIYSKRDDYNFEQTGLKFQPFEKYEYPPSDIKKITYEDGVFNFVLTFLGLYGINSPLPRCYHEQVDFQQRVLGFGQVPLQNFLDIFNNRFYWLYYQSWKKYRFYLHLNSDENNKIIRRINSFSGRGFLRKNKNTSISDFALLKFSGLFSQRVRNKTGLKILLRYLFPQFEMEIKEYVPTWLELSDTAVLGSNENILGETSFLGRHTLDYTSRICIEIGPISFEDYLEFLPSREQSPKLTELLELYLNDGLEFDFAFKIIGESIITISCDDDRVKLGSTVWLGTPHEEIVNAYMPYEQICQTN